MSVWIKPSIDSMTALAIYNEQRDHVTFIHRISKAQLIAQRATLERAYKSKHKTVKLAVRVSHLRACRAALDEVFRRVDAAKAKRSRRSTCR